MNQLFIIRGLPGSGKTTLAYQLADEVYEADMFFLRDGVYLWDRNEIADAHEWCQNQVRNAMISNISNIAVSNTFVRRWEMEEYYKMAAIYGYRVTEITMSGILHKNVHNVPDETIERMRASWER